MNVEVKGWENRQKMSMKNSAMTGGSERYLPFWSVLPGRGPLSDLRIFWRDVRWWCLCWRWVLYLSWPRATASRRMRGRVGVYASCHRSLFGFQGWCRTLQEHRHASQAILLGLLSWPACDELSSLVPSSAVRLQWHCERLLWLGVTNWIPKGSSE